MSEDTPPLLLRIKIEINTREHFRVLPMAYKALDVRSRWFEGHADIPVYQIEELMATKLRALYQRRKGRDLFDLAPHCASRISARTWSLLPLRNT